MLVVTRRPGEGVQIGGKIRVRILAIERDEVRIGIDAPSSLRISRIPGWRPSGSAGAQLKDESVTRQSPPLPGSSSDPPALPACEGTSS